MGREPDRRDTGSGSDCPRDRVFDLTTTDEFKGRGNGSDIGVRHYLSHRPYSYDVERCDFCKFSAGWEKVSSLWNFPLAGWDGTL